MDASPVVSTVILDGTSSEYSGTGAAPSPATVMSGTRSPERSEPSAWPACDSGLPRYSTMTWLSVLAAVSRTRPLSSASGAMCVISACATAPW